jgi:peptidoglycan hydrolase-like protein with peptidoglycan-binding domain
MTRFKLLTIASAVAAALAVPAALAQQSGAPDSPSSRVQQRDATGNPAGSPTQPPRSMSSDRGVNDPTLRSGSTMGHSQYDSSTVRDVQQALQNKGYDVGPIDGVMGPRTQSALREFQQQQGLTRSGRIDQRTMSALDVRASGAGGTMSDRSSSRSGTGDRAAGTGASGSGAIGSGSPSGSAGAGGTTAAPGSVSGTPGGSTRPGSEGASGTGASGSGAIGSSPSGSGSAGSGGTTGGGRGG